MSDYGRMPARALARTAQQHAEDVRARAEQTRRRASMEQRRREAVLCGLEGTLARLLAGRSLGQAIGDVWAAGYARGWRDRERELTR